MKPADTLSTAIQYKEEADLHFQQCDFGSESADIGKSRALKSEFLKIARSPACKPRRLCVCVDFDVKSKGARRFLGAIKEITLDGCLSFGCLVKNS